MRRLSPAISLIRLSVSFSLSARCVARCSANQDGTIALGDVGAVVRGLGVKLTEARLSRLINRLDVDTLPQRGPDEADEACGEGGARVDLASLLAVLADWAVELQGQALLLVGGAARA